MGVLKFYILFTVSTRYLGNLFSKDLIFLDSFTLYIVLTQSSVPHNIFQHITCPKDIRCSITQLATSRGMLCISIAIRSWGATSTADRLSMFPPPSFPIYREFLIVSDASQVRRCMHGRRDLQIDQNDWIRLKR